MLRLAIQLAISHLVNALLIKVLFLSNTSHTRDDNLLCKFTLDGYFLNRRDKWR